MPKYTVELTGLMLSPGGRFLARVYTQFELLPNGQRMVHATKCIVVFKGSVFKEYPELSLAALNAELDSLEREDAQNTKETMTSGWSSLDKFNHWNLPVTEGAFDPLLTSWSTTTPAARGSLGL